MPVGVPRRKKSSKDSGIGSSLSGSSSKDTSLSSSSLGIPISLSAVATAANNAGSAATTNSVLKLSRNAVQVMIRKEFGSKFLGTIF